MDKYFIYLAPDAGMSVKKLQKSAILKSVSSWQVLSYVNEQSISKQPFFIVLIEEFQNGSYTLEERR